MKGNKISVLKKIVLTIFLSLSFCGLFAQYTLTDDDVTVESGELKQVNLPFGQYQVIIPNVLQGQTITSIGEAALYGERLTSLELPSTVKSIGFEAFAYNRLTSLSIPASVTEIGDLAFVSNTIASLTFEGESQVKTIGESAFKENKLNSLVIPKSITHLGDYSFYHNPLSALVFEEGSLLTDIGKYSFHEARLSQLTIPESVVRIGDYAFYKNQIKSIDFGENSKLVEVGEYAFKENQLVRLNFPQGVQMIGWSAFQDNRIQEITFSDQATLRIIESFAFSGNKLAVVNFPQSLQEIGYRSFRDNRLTEITFPEGSNLTSIDSCAFFNNQLDTVALPNQLMYVGAEAFLYNNFPSFILPGELEGWQDTNGGMHACGDEVDSLQLSYWRLGFVDIELRKPLIVTINSIVKEYGEPMPDIFYSIDGFDDGDDESMLDYPPGFITTASQYSDVGTYEIRIYNPEGENGGYYFDNGTPGILTIVPKPISIDADVDDKVYDGNRNATLSNIVLNGVIANDDVNYAGENNSLFDNPNVGNNKVVTSAFTLTGEDAGNYTIVQPELRGNIIPKDIYVVNPSVQDKNSDGTTNAVIEYGVDGIVNGDKIDVGYAAEFEDGAVGENVKVISDWWINGEDSGNYNIVSPGDLYGNIGTPIEILSKWGYVLFINNDDNLYQEYQWYKDGLPIEGATAQRYFTGDRTLCGNFSCRVTYVVDDMKFYLYSKTYTHNHNCGGASAPSLEIYPTVLKAGSKLTIDKGQSLDQSKSYKVTIHNSEGLLVSTNQYGSLENIQVESPATSGIYVLQLFHGEELIRTERLVVNN